VRSRDGDPIVDVVAGPTTGGIILAFETARQLGLRSIFGEEVRDADGTTHRAFRRGFRIEPGERVLLVDDILTTGGSLLAMIPAVEAQGGEIVECDVLVDRSGGRAALESPATGRSYALRSLWQLDLPTYEPGPKTCPRCADGTPLHAPGSTGTGTGPTGSS
jgi:orotate phosphoribosyltransferase